MSCRERGNACERVRQSWFRHGVAAGCLLLSAASAPRAQWDASGGVTAREIWAENTTFSARSGNGDAISAVRLQGRAVRKGPRFDLDAYYSPEGQLYRDQSELNRVVHDGRLKAGWEVSPVDTLSFSGRTFYSPDQGLSRGSVQDPLVFTRFTDRRTFAAALDFKHSLSARTDVVAEVREYFQTFSNPDLIDSAGVGLGLHVTRQIAPRASLDFGIGNAWNRFVHTKPAIEDPNTGATLIPAMAERSESQVTSPSVGLAAGVGARTTINARLGYNIATPSDPSLPRRSGVHAQALLTWSGKRLDATGGYTRDFSVSSGTAAVSQHQTWHTSLGYDFTMRFRGSLSFNRTINESVTGSAANESTRTLNGQALLKYRVGGAISLFSEFSRYLQNSHQLNAPDVASNRYTVGLTAEFN